MQSLPYTVLKLAFLQWCLIPIWTKMHYRFKICNFLYRMLGKVNCCYHKKCLICDKFHNKRIFSHNWYDSQCKVNKIRKTKFKENLQWETSQAQTQLPAAVNYATPSESISQPPKFAERISQNEEWKCFLRRKRIKRINLLAIIFIKALSDEFHCNSTLPSTTVSRDPSISSCLPIAIIFCR